MTWSLWQEKAVIMLLWALLLVGLVGGVKLRSSITLTFVAYQHGRTSYSSLIFLEIFAIRRSRGFSYNWMAVYAGQQKLTLFAAACIVFQFHPGLPSDSHESYTVELPRP